MQKLEAIQWLKDARQRVRDNLSQPASELWVAHHAVNCPCREFTVDTILRMLLRSDREPQVSTNTGKSRQPNSYYISTLDDNDLYIDRRSVRFVIRFFEEEARLPTIVSSWRDGSPDPALDNPPCFKNSQSPPCFESAHKKRKRKSSKH